MRMFYKAGAGLVASGALAGALVMGIAGAASAAPSNINATVVSGTIVARGVAVAASVSYLCPSIATFSYISVYVSERSGNTIVNGSGQMSSPDVICDGNTHLLTINVNTGYLAPSPFKPGIAEVNTYIAAVDPTNPYGYDQASSTQTLRITNN